MPTMFPGNPTRLDPYKNFKFRIKWDGKYVAAVSKISTLKRTTEVITHRSGGDPSTPMLTPGKTKFEGITCERGLTQDMAFHEWAGLVWNYGSALGTEVSLANFRKSLYIEFYNEAGQLAMAFKVYRCWVSEYQALPDLDANGNAIAIEHIKIENEGWERDTGATELAEPTLSTIAV
ncbi:MAG: phage tail protein [Terracidiphilus sp.]